VKRKLLYIGLNILIMFLGAVTMVSANSSWHWLTDDTPLVMLPWAIVVTLFVEVVFIYFFNRIKGIILVTVTVTVANLMSFLAPLLLIPYEIPLTGVSLVEAVNYHFAHYPAYIVGTGFFLLTFFVEAPIVYLVLKRKVKERSRLILSIFIINFITTLLIAFIEYFLFYGSW